MRQRITTGAAAWWHIIAKGVAQRSRRGVPHPPQDRSINALIFLWKTSSRKFTSVSREMGPEILSRGIMLRAIYPALTPGLRATPRGVVVVASLRVCHIAGR